MTAPTPPTPPPTPPYMTYIKSRNPEFKTHTNIGHVKNAIRGSLGSWRGGQYLYAYELKDGEYQVMWTIPQDSKPEDLPWDVYVPPPYQPPHVPCNCPNCK